MEKRLPRLLIGGTQSGCGKTTITNAILQALVLRGLAPAAFKCGPDYIDPMFHTEIVGVPSRNLDLFMCEENTVRFLLARGAGSAKIAVIEGVMGYYDGVGGCTVQASASDLAVRTATPSVLVMSIQGQSLTAAALLHGLCAFAPNSVCGVILNGVTESMYTYYKDIIEQNTGVHVYGFMPRVPEAEIASRHLGLKTAGEIINLKAQMQKLAQLAEKYIDVEGLIKLARTAPPVWFEPIEATPKPPVRIAVAKDAAFCFYYADNLELLSQLGAKLVPFSPLKDKSLPKKISGIYLGGGYPELYAQTLSENTQLHTEIRQAVDKGIPTFAECGGFLYLHRTLTDMEGKKYPMAGVLQQDAVMGKRLTNFGYVTLTAQQDTLMCAVGDSIRAHEFHYAKSNYDGAAFDAQKPLRKNKRQCICAEKNLFAGFPHLHFYANPAFAATFVNRCNAYQERENA